MSVDAQQAEEYQNRGRQLFDAGDLAGACRDLARSVVHAERAGQQPSAAARSLLGRAYFWLGKFEQARVLLTGRDVPNAIWTASAWIRGEPAPAPAPNEADAFLMLGYGATLAGRFEPAMGYLSGALQRAESQPAGLPFLRFATLGWLGVIALRTGHVDRAATLLSRALRLAEAHPGLTTHQPIFQAARAELVLGGGNFTAAVRLAEEALDLAERTQQPLAQALCQHTLARMVPAAPNPDWEAAEEMLGETMLYFEREGAAPLLAATLYEQGLLHAARGDAAAARRALTRSCDQFSALQMVWYQMQARLDLASLGQ